MVSHLWTPRHRKRSRLGPALLAGALLAGAPLLITPASAQLLGVQSAYVSPGRRDASPRSPTLSFSTYLGGSAGDTGWGVAVDSSGDIYTAGSTASPDFPLASAAQGRYGGGPSDAFVTKFDPAGHLLYSTFLGGSGEDSAFAVAVDASGNAYIVGATTSPDFPTANAFRATYAGAEDAFLTKLSPSGGIVYSTYLGGSGFDQAWSVAVNSSGSAFVAGTTYSDDFPTASAFQPSNRGLGDAFVSRFAPSGTSLVYSTFLGGTTRDGALGVALDSSGEATVAGETTSPDFPTRRPLQATHHGEQDAFVARLDPSGGALVFSTFLGGAGDDMAWAVAVSASSGATYLTGYTASTDFPLRGAYQPANGGAHDGFVSALAPDGQSLLFSTYLGGNGGYDAGYGVAVDPAGRAYVSGLTSSTNFPAVNAVQSSSHGGDEAFLTCFSPTGASLVYSTYLGGTDNDYAYGVAIDRAGTAYFAGETHSTDFPLAHAYQGALAGPRDSFVAAISPAPQPTPTPCSPVFSDVRPGDYFYEAVSNLYCRGAIAGYADGTFRPYNYATRGQLARVLVLAEGWPINTSGGPHFYDVPPGSPLYSYVETTYNRGVVSGYVDGTFRPIENVTRAQLCKMVVNAQQWAINTAGGPHFSDLPPDAPFYGYVETAYNRGVVSGYADGAFRPGSNATRGQACKILYAALVAP